MERDPSSQRGMKGIRSGESSSQISRYLSKPFKAISEVAGIVKWNFWSILQLLCFFRIGYEIDNLFKIYSEHLEIIAVVFFFFHNHLL